MRPESIDAHESHISLSMEEANQLGKAALDKGDIHAAVTLLGTGAVMAELQNQEATQAAEETTIETDVTDTEVEASERSVGLGARAMSDISRFREKRPRGVGRPAEYQDPRFHYGNHR